MPWLSPIPPDATLPAPGAVHGAGCKGSAPELRSAPSCRIRPFASAHAGGKKSSLLELCLDEI